jgi:hypothetical protein
MATQTYCVRRDVVSILGEAGLLACIDDNANGQADPDEIVFITDAINRSASEMNHSLGKQYSPLSSLAGNEWCKWCNAYIAAFYLQSRRGNAPVGSVMESTITYRQQLEAIQWGRDSVPEASPTHNHSPAVTNFNIRPNSPDGPVVVDLDQSTGGNPGAGVKRNLGLSNFF